MLQNELHLRARSRKPRAIGHLRRKNLQIEAPSIFSKPRDVATDCCVSAEIGTCSEAVERIFVPVQLHACAAHQRIARETVELRAHVVDAKIRIGDEGEWPSGLI